MISRGPKTTKGASGFPGRPSDSSSPRLSLLALWSHLRVVVLGGGGIPGIRDLTILATRKKSSFQRRTQTTHDGRGAKRLGNRLCFEGAEHWNFVSGLVSRLVPPQGAIGVILAVDYLIVKDFFESVG